ncbi:hypothetical protein [Formosa sp. PL04]|uniref:hypothetical protein n=1 Tax=Formosa sp. PL04 TaxID=3081755 RepID=UPI002980B2C1|nr:hypothetical protein [Formosa sp. PL04]MDW5290996.1 hypothetical protein [Formosa sp. PL04]
MKKIFISSFFLIFIIVSLKAQSSSTPKNIVTKADGKEMIDHITVINELVGFNNKSISEHSDLQSPNNKAAILPFTYTENQNKDSDSINDEIQNELFIFFNKHKKHLQFQNPETTNTLLVKAGLSNNDLKGVTMSEISNILGVEYVIQGTVSVKKVKPNFLDTDGYIVGSETQKTNGAVIDTNNPDYSTTMYLNVYNDKGDSVFSQGHTSFWDNEDAYKITIDYLGRKTPLYKK